MNASRMYVAAEQQSFNSTTGMWLLNLWLNNGEQYGPGLFYLLHHVALLPAARGPVRDEGL